MTTRNTPVFVLASLLIMLLMTACSGGTEARGELPSDGAAIPSDGPQAREQLSNDASTALGAGPDTLDSDRNLPDNIERGDGLSEEMADRIASRLDEADYEYDADAQTLTITTTFDEAQINEVINRTFEEAGYGPASVDFVPGGITIVVEDLTYEGQNYGTVTLSVNVSATDCRVQPTITEASAGGRSLPQPLIDELNTKIAEAWTNAIDTMLSNTDLPSYLDWCVTNVGINDTTATVTVVFSW